MNPNYDLVDKLKLVNEKYHNKWMSDRMAKGYSFIYEKGTIHGVSINIMVICVETEEFLDMEWE